MNRRASSGQGVDSHVEEVLGPVLLGLLCYDFEVGLGEELFEERDGSGHAEVFLVNYKTCIAVVFLQYYDSTILQGTFGANKELDSVLVVEMRKDPLYPYAVVLLIEL